MFSADNNVTPTLVWQKTQTKENHIRTEASHSQDTNLTPKQIAYNSEMRPVGSTSYGP